MELEEGDVDDDHDGKGDVGEEPPAWGDAAASEQKIDKKDGEDDGAGTVEPEGDLLGEETGFAHGPKNAMADVNDDAGVESEAAHPKREADEDQVTEQERWELAWHFE